MKTPEQMLAEVRAVEDWIAEEFEYRGPIIADSEQRSMAQEMLKVSNGKNTCIFDDQGNPSIMVKLPQMLLSDLHDEWPEQLHPAFVVNDKPAQIYISKYQNIVVGSGDDARPISLRRKDPRTYIDFDTAFSVCKQKGEGWHLMTNAEWAAIALWCKKNSFQPRGNNYYGKDISRTDEQGETSYIYSDDRKGRVYTGTGPLGWSHDGSPFGIWDLNGNIWEWVHGLRLRDGKIWIIDDNDFTAQNVEGDTTGWIDTGVYIDNTTAGDAQEDSHDVGGDPIFGSTLEHPMYTGTNNGDFGYSSIKYQDLATKSGFSVPDILKWLAIFPAESDGYGDDSVWVRNYGERLPRRGGNWYAGSSAGVFYLDLLSRRTHSDGTGGFRSAFVSL